MKGNGRKISNMGKVVILIIKETKLKVTGSTGRKSANKNLTVYVLNKTK